MKLTSILILTIALFACSQEPTPNREKQIQPKRKAIQETKPSEKSASSNTVPKTNYTDSNGLKQGKWITKGYKNKVVRIETFKNGILDGYWFNWEGMQEEGTYVNGKKHGFFSVFYGDKSEQEVMQLKLYQKDSVLWFACPTADKRAAIPIKGFKTNADSVFIEAPHYNGSIWYKGLFIDNQPTGIHFIYDENQQLLAKTNYMDSSIQLTKYANEDFIRSTTNFARDMRIILE